MSAKQAVRDELRKAEEARDRAARRTIDTAVATNQAKVDALTAALEALNGHPSPAPSSGDRPRVRDYHGRRPISETTQVVFDWLRNHPEESVSAHELGKHVGSPNSTIAVVIERELEADKPRVEVVGETPRGKPIVKYRPQSVKPGQAEAVKG